MRLKNIKKHHFKLISCGLFGCFTVIIPFIIPLFFNFIPDLSVTEIRAIATKITVQVFSQDQPIGTGFIFKNNNNLYRILTNHHVIEDAEKPFKIKTFDGKFYTANLKFPRLNKNDDDLAILEFKTSKNINYKIADFAPGKIGDNVYAGGFPVVLNDDFNQIRPTPLNKKGSNDMTYKNKFIFNKGKINLILKKPMKGGYQIGYTNDIEKGMSGSALINQKGQVIAINGMNAEPLWGDPYIYKDGTLPEPKLHKQMYKYSWGIPIDTFTNFYYNKIKLGS